jgi:DNA-binding winged helix-turn-helix (wHTH) protein/tetratricopeptide (TPR) repeat protein
MRSFGPFRLDEANQCLWRADMRVPLMPKPFAVLRYLVEHAGQLVTQDQLLAAIWPDTYVQPEVLRRYVLEIRRALNDRAEAPAFVQTLPKRGYQFIAPVIEDDERSTTGSSARSTLVGRDSALADLSRCLTTTLGGRRQIVFVAGEHGIGKTSLVDAFADASRGTEALHIVRGQAVEGFAGKEPYYPLLEAIGELARGPAKSLVVETLTTHAPTWLTQFPALIVPEQHAALLREIRGAPRERMVRELCEALDVLTESVPLVLILEDLHWVDYSTLDMISALARRRQPARLLVVGTFRPADVIVSDSPLKGLKQDLLLHHLCHEIELERLEESDVEAYLAGGFGDEVPAGFASVIQKHSDGNPLFMTAMLDHLAQQGLLVRENDRWKLTVPIDQVDPGVPDTLKQMLEIQLLHLGEEEQQILKCASVAGPVFNVWSVATMMERDAPALERVFERLAERHQFLEPLGTRDVSSDISSFAYRFRHALYREVLYRRLNSDLRSGFHRRLASGLEGIHASADELAAEIALHFEAGHESERAIPYLLRAAQTATRTHAHREAADLLEHAREIALTIADRSGELELQILERIGNAYYALGDMERSAEAYRSMATLAARAGVLRTHAERLMRVGHSAESIPFYLRALELDPSFASAYVALSRTYSNLGEAARATQFAGLAFERGADVSARDRLSITYQYHYEVTGDQNAATKTLEAWKESFPSEFQPVNSLTVIHNFLGCFEHAIEEGLEAVKREPSHGYPYSNLAHAFRGIGDFDSARTVAERAVAQGIETLPTRRLLYQLALIAGDECTAAKQLEWARDRPREFDIVGARAQATGWAGKVAEARALYDQAAQMAETRHLPDVGTSHLAARLSMEWAYGNVECAATLAERILAREPSYDPLLRAALALGISGHAHDAVGIVRRLSADRPAHTMINDVLAPIALAGIELGQNRPDRAIACLERVVPFECGFIAALAPVYLRGQALLMLGEGDRAAREFQRLIDRRGSDPFSAFHAVADVGIARACAIAGNPDGSRAAYERFLSCWKDADPSIPILTQARFECRHRTNANALTGR